MNKTAAAIALIITLMGVVVVGYVIFKDEIAAVWGPSESCVAFEVVVYFEDGSTKTYTAPSNSLTPLSITDTSGKEISRMDFYLLTTLVTSSEVLAWSITGTQQMEMYLKPSTTPKTSATMTITEVGSSWPSGNQKQINYFALQKSEIEAVTEQYGDGNYLFQVIASIDVTVTFPDGDASAQATAIGGIDFIYAEDTGTIDSFTVTVQTEPLSIL